ncbi:MAG TPA: FAD-binding protein [Phycisphaerae bacterium]|nr:FAD-binding protein [Phycisphaerae bacterium]
MALLIRNLSLPLDVGEELLSRRAAKRLRIHPGDIRKFSVVRRAVDARDKRAIQFVYNVEVELAGGAREEARILKKLRRSDITEIQERPPPPLEHGTEKLTQRPVVVGLGPAGMFAALWLAKHGLKPIVLERGQPVRVRHRDIMHRFYRLHEFDSESNLLFGEGGAGAYSDGKLYTRVNDPRMNEILRVFVEHGAPEDILIDARPHLGSDRVPTLCWRIRDTITALGGEIRFGARLDDLEIEDGAIKAIRVTHSQKPTKGAQPDSEGEPFETIVPGPLLLGPGHSARDTLRMLVQRGVSVAAKPFQLGVRVEHPQALVDRWQYGASCGHKRLPPAEYHLVSKGSAGKLGDVYSFCMCPGGVILPTNESPGLIATNGASGVDRDKPLANSGIVMTVPVEQFGDEPLRGLDFVEHWERVAFQLTGETYRVPCQRASDFVAGRLPKVDEPGSNPETSYPLQGQWADIRKVLPEFVADAVRLALIDLDRRLPGFAGPEAIVTGPESRASAPVRIPRDPQTRESISTRGLYPIGEGAGYAGGIMSAAADGIATAEMLIRRYAPLG